MILKVPYYSQYQSTGNPEWKENSCGVVSLKMVLDYYQPTNLTVDQLYEKGLELNGYLEGVGWYHHSLVLLAKELRFSGITRSWEPTEEYVKILKNRGFKDGDLQILKDQQYNEGIFCLKNELDKNHPIIVSVTTGFGRYGKGHLVVLIGYDEAGFILHDPFEEIRPGKEFKISFDDFKKTWTKRALFVYPKYK